jgi:AraC-like DNA-binding protein
MDSDLNEEATSRTPGMDFVRFQALPGLEVMDVRGISRLWANFHETYSFCVATWVDEAVEVPWKYRRRTHRMNVDRVQLMEPGEFHTNLRTAPPADFRVLMLSPDLVARVAQSLGWEKTSPLHLKVADLGDGPVRRILRRLTTAAVEDRSVERAHADLSALLSTLSTNSCLERPIPNGPGRPSRKLALRARDFIHDRWALHVPLEDISGDLGVSIPTLERVFSEAFGTTPKRYQNHVRLMRGKMLLAAPDHSIKTISKLCGFDDRKYFARLFRRQFGHSPESYRKGPPTLR